METRRSRSFHQGTISEQRFQHHLNALGVSYTVTVGTDADTKGKIDFIVNGKTVNVKAPTMSGPRGLCVEWRAVNGSTGWLHKIDYIVKFIDDKRYVKIPVAKLKEHVVAKHGEPPARCPQTGARHSGGNWYARANWDGKDRTGEACIMIPAKEILPFSTIENIQ